MLSVPVVQMCEVAPLSAASPRLTSGAGEDDTGGAEVVITHRGPPQHCPPPSTGPPTCYHKLTHPPVIYTATVHYGATCNISIQESGVCYKDTRML